MKLSDHFSFEELTQTENRDLQEENRKLAESFKPVWGIFTETTRTLWEDLKGIDQLLRFTFVCKRKGIMPDPKITKWLSEYKF